MSRLFPLLVLAVACTGAGCATRGGWPCWAWDKNTDQKLERAAQEFLQTNAAPAVATNAATLEGEMWDARYQSAALSQLVATNRPTKPGYYFTNPPGYVYFVQTNGVAKWQTNGPLPVYTVIEIDVYGDKPHQDSLSIMGPWSIPASNTYCVKWTPGFAGKWRSAAINQFFRGHVLVTKYGAILPQWEVSYATNFPT